MSNDTPIPHMFVVLRDKLSGASLLMQYGHACSEAVPKELAPLDKRTIEHCACATKARLTDLLPKLREALGPRLAEVYENTGELAKSTLPTAVAFVTLSEEEGKALVGHLPATRFDRISGEGVECRKCHQQIKIRSLCDDCASAETQP